MEAPRRLCGIHVQPGSLLARSSCKVPAVVGVCTVAREAYPDPTQFEEGHKYFDPKSTREKPRWVAVDVTFVRRLPRPVTLQDIKQAASQEDAPPQLRDFFLARICCSSRDRPWPRGRRGPCLPVPADTAPAAVRHASRSGSVGVDSRSRE